MPIDEHRDWRARFVINGSSFFGLIVDGGLGLVSFVMKFARRNDARDLRPIRYFIRERQPRVR